MHMRDRPSAYEAACIDQPKSATTPGVLSASLAFFGTTAKGGGAARCWRTWEGVAAPFAVPWRGTPRRHGGRPRRDLAQPPPPPTSRDVTRDSSFLYLSLFATLKPSDCTLRVLFVLRFIGLARTFLSSRRSSDRRTALVK